MDVAIGVNVIAEEGTAFSGTRIRELAEAAGFKLEPDGVFHYRSGERQTLFTLDNHEPAPFLPEQLKSLTTRGVTLMLDVPRVADGAGGARSHARDRARARAALGGKLVDDNRAALTEAGIARIREQLRSIHAAMAARGMRGRRRARAAAVLLMAGVRASTSRRGSRRCGTRSSAPTTSTTCSTLPRMPDAEYDRLFRELQALEASIPALRSAGFADPARRRRGAHRPARGAARVPMLSIRTETDSGPAARRPSTSACAAS